MIYYKPCIDNIEKYSWDIYQNYNSPIYCSANYKNILHRVLTKYNMFTSSYVTIKKINCKVKCNSIFYWILQLCLLYGCYCMRTLTRYSRINYMDQFVPKKVLHVVTMDTRFILCWRSRMVESGALLQSSRGSKREICSKTVENARRVQL